MQSERAVLKVQFKAKISIELDTIEEADVIGRSLSVDDDEFVKTRVEGRRIEADLSSDSIEGLKRAGDDWLACLQVALREPKEY